MHVQTSSSYDEGVGMKRKTHNKKVILMPVYKASRAIPTYRIYHRSREKKHFMEEVNDAREDILILLYGRKIYGVCNKSKNNFCGGRE